MAGNRGKHDGHTRGLAADCSDCIRCMGDAARETAGSMTVKRIKVGPSLAMVSRPPKMLVVKTSKDWGADYELVVSYYGYSQGIDVNIARVAGLKHYDTGYQFANNQRELQFFGGTD